MATTYETAADYIAALRKQYPGLWEALADDQKDKVRSWARDAAQGQTAFFKFRQQVEGAKFFETYQSQQAAPPVEDTGTGVEDQFSDFMDNFSDPTSSEKAMDSAMALSSEKDIRATLKNYLQEWGLSGLEGFVQDAIKGHWTGSEIMANLRETDAYKAAFPENEARRKAGFSWWSEQQILEYRDQARRLAAEYLGIRDVSNDEISKLVAGNVSLPEWENRLRTQKAFQQWGPAVQQALSQELGVQVSDDRVFAFMNPDISTPELDRAYQVALMRGQPAQLGLGLRPEEEAQKLREFGLSPEEAFKGYQGIASELPRQERLAAIEAHLAAQGDQLPTAQDALAGATFGQLFNAIQLQDAQALATLQGVMAREVARFKAGGGVARQGTKAIGLMGKGQQA